MLKRAYRGDAERTIVPDSLGFGGRWKEGKVHLISCYKRKWCSKYVLPVFAGDRVSKRDHKRKVSYSTCATFGLIKSFMHKLFLTFILIYAHFFAANQIHKTKKLED